MKKFITLIAAAFTLFVVATSIGGCASCSRGMNSLSSDINGGLDRTVTVYDYNGNVIGEWSGKFDVSNNDNEIYFDDENGNRVIVQNGIIVCEEN